MRDTKAIPAPPSTSGIPNNLQTYSDNYVIKVNPTDEDFKGGKNKSWILLLWRTTSEKSKDNSTNVDYAPKPSGLHLNDPQHMDRIEMNMCHLEMTIESSIDDAAQCSNTRQQDMKSVSEEILDCRRHMEIDTGLAFSSVMKKVTYGHGETLQGNAST